MVKKKMNLNEDHPIMKQIEIDRNHIENFVLETEEGTKKTKKKFHEKAVHDRNQYIQRQKSLFDQYRIQYKNEIIVHYKSSMPENHTQEQEEKIKEVEELLELVKLQSTISNSFKLGLDFIVASIRENSSLEDINLTLKKFIEQLKNFGVSLTIEDFKYTMFTERYMHAFFENDSKEKMKEVFEKIYFTSPDIKLQLKMNLEYILEKYQDKLEKCVVNMRNTLYQKYQVDPKNLLNQYTEMHQVLGNLIKKDPYHNTMLFLEKKKKISDYMNDSPTRIKNYNMFSPNNNYQELIEEEKKNYHSVIESLYYTLYELKKYYRYEFILKDLLERYKDKDVAKVQYQAKKKEIEKEEKKRKKIYKQYLKSTGSGFFRRKNDIKMKNIMLEMNEHIRKLHDLHEEFKDIKLTYQLTELTASASIYELFKSALNSFSFLEKSFQGNEEFQNHTLEENMDEYFKFIYHPHNSLSRKVNVFADYDIISVVAEKYKLLNLIITREMIDKDNIDSTLDNVQFIYFIQNVEDSPISLEDIEMICKMKEIIAEDNIEGEEII